MTLLTQERGPFGRAPYSSREAAGTATANAHLTMIKRFCKFALAVLVVGGALAGIIALKAAVFLPRLNF
jgi:hypothetical protein